MLETMLASSREVNNKKSIVPLLSSSDRSVHHRTEPSSTVFDSISHGKRSMSFSDQEAVTVGKHIYEEIRINFKTLLVKYGVRLFIRCSYDDIYVDEYFSFKTALVSRNTSK